MSFNRRQNRIAGPGFHLNVRYDDQTMAEAMSVRPTANELQLGRTRRENFDVKENELLVCMKAGAMYHDGYTHCFSMANGLKSEMEGPLEIAQDILSKVQYVGVATTEYKPTKAYSEQGFVAQVGGVVTLLNEGQDTLKPGDSVSLGLNLKINKRLTRDKGIPRDKIRFCLTKTNIGDELIRQAVVNANLSTNLLDAASGSVENELEAVRTAEAALQAAIVAKSGINAALVNKREKLEALVTAQGAALKGEAADLKQFLNAYQELNKRVIGKVASYARQGDRVEVILQPRNPY
tara:strand:- start:16652 stop:17530 length:879 start_codon:yes stop_codon:yes gene_type:complete